MSRHEILSALAECKAEGKCARDKVATAYLVNRVRMKDASAAAHLEHYRLAMSLPPCPPVCPEPPLLETDRHV